MKAKTNKSPGINRINNEIVKSVSFASNRNNQRYIQPIPIGKTVPIDRP